MTTYRALALADRVLLVRETGRTIVLSELEISAAELLGRQIEIALISARQVARSACTSDLG